MDGIIPEGLLSPQQMEQLQQQRTSDFLLALGSGLAQTSQGMGRRPSTLAGITAALPGAVQAQRSSFDKTLQDMLRAQQIQDMQKQRAQQAQQQQQLETFVSGLPESEQARFRAFPTQAAEAMFREQKGTYRPLSSEEVISMTGYTPKPGEAFQLSPQGKLEPITRPERGPLVQNVIGGEKLSPGEIEQDKDFGKEIGQWKRGGGQDMAAQIAQLKPVIESLEAGEPITGVSVAVQPDILLAMTNPKALQSRELVEEVVQRNLKTILGGQFTEREGDRLISRAFNPKLPPEENAKRVRRLFLQMSSAAEQKQAMADYFDQFGTLRGYRGKMPTVQDFYNAMEGDSGTMQIPVGSNVQDAARRELELRRGR
jgi:hypothetical protein